MKEIDLSESGLEFVAASLRNESGLSHKLAGLPIFSGKCFAPLPDGLTIDQARRFHSGIISISKTHSDVDNWMIEHLKSLWSRFKSGSIIFQDVWANEQDLRSTNPKEIALFSGSFGVCHVLEYNDLNVDRLNFVLSDVVSFKQVGCYTTETVPENSFTPVVADRIVNNVKEIFITSYDNEGYVVWKR